VSRRKVVTEITIETNQVLVIKRRQVSRLWYGECGSEAELVRLKEANARMDETGNQHAAEALSGSPHFTNVVEGFHVIWVRSLLGAATLAKRLINCLCAAANGKVRPRE
jgi:hypothetical protein